MSFILAPFFIFFFVHEFTEFTLIFLSESGFTGFKDLHDWFILKSYQSINLVNPDSDNHHIFSLFTFNFSLKKKLYLCRMNIRLRAVEIGDADLIYRWENSYSLWGVSSTRAPFSHYAIEQYVKGTQNEDIYSSKQIRFMIDALDEGEVKTVGCVDLYDLEPQHSRAGVGIFVQEGDYRRRHIALNALQWIEKYAFEILNLHQLYAYVTQDNSSSIRLFYKASYFQSAVLKDWVRKENNFFDVLVFQKSLGTNV